VSFTRRHFLWTSGLTPAAGQLLGGVGQPQQPARHKLVLIGAGSAVFTQGIIIDWLQRRPEGEWEIALVDINPVILEATEKMVRRYMFSSGSPAKITATTDRREVLAGATVVTCTIGVGGRRAWEQDVFIPRKYGIYQPVGDSVMPGGISRAMRMIPPMVEIARDAARLCPQAIFINYSNPLTAIIRAIRRKTTVPAVGLCIGTHDTLLYLAELAGVPFETVTAAWAGVNHLTWVYDLRSEGKDLWPTIREKVSRQRRKGIDQESLAHPSGRPQNPEYLAYPFSWELFDIFGAFPAPKDRHVTEYFPERFPRGRYYGRTLGVDVFSFEDTIERGDKIYEETISLAKGEGPIEPKLLRRTRGEHIQMWEILDSIRRDKRRWYSVNVPNGGAVSNLPKDAVLELPGIATAPGILTPALGELPPPIASVTMRRLAAIEATVEAALTGSRKLMTEAMILDGGVPDYSTAAKLTEELLKAQAEHLPEFA
jgi:alpha-galactosidase